MWQDKYIAPLPQVGNLQDVTAHVTKRLYGRGFDTLIGGDFQQDCAMVAIKLLAPDGDLSQMKFWTVDAWYGGDEYEIIDAMERSGYAPGRALVICDASGTWQTGIHKGGTSIAIFKKRGWEITPVEQPRGEGERPKNPPRARSFGQLRKMIETERVWVAPGAKYMSTSLKKCVAKFDGFGNILSQNNTRYSHHIDCLRYAIHWALARPGILQAPTEMPAHIRALIKR